MVKVTTTIRIDLEALEIAKEKRLNVSELAQEAIYKAAEVEHIKGDFCSYCGETIKLGEQFWFNERCYCKEHERFAR